MIEVYDDVEDSPDAATWSPPPVYVPPPRRRWVVSVTVRVPPGAPEHERERLLREAWGLHITAALLEGRCPRCYSGLTAEIPERPGWRLCPVGPWDGWWRRWPTRYGIPGGWEWKLGVDPHTGESSW